DLSERLLALAADYLAPTLTMLGALLAWEALVYFKEIPPYLLPAPSLILKTLVTDFGSLVPSLLFTIRLTVLSLCLAVAGGVFIGPLFALSRTVERSLFPFAVILQVTPIVAIAPLILIYVE